MKQILLLSLISLFLCHSISQNGINLIKRFEGCKLKAYKDSVGVWTIGYGTTSADESITGTSIYEGLTITQATADEWLRLSVNKKYGPKVDKFDNIYRWTQNEFDALCSFAYNIGSIDGLVQNGNREKSKLTSAMKQYVYANGSKLSGLVKRRNAEVDLFNKDGGGDDDCSNITEKAKCIEAKCKWTEQRTGTCSGPKCEGSTKTDCENTIGCTFANEIGNCAVPECFGESKYRCEKTAGCKFTPVKGSCSCEYCAIWKCNCLGNKDCEEKGDMIDCVNSGCEWKNCSVINSANICTAKNEDECLDQSDYPTICGWVTTCERMECGTKATLDECTSAKCTWAETGICEPSISSNNCQWEKTSGTCVESVSCTGNTQETCGTSCTWTAATGFCSNDDDKDDRDDIDDNVDIDVKIIFDDKDDKDDKNDKKAKDSSFFTKSSGLILLLLSLY